MLLYKQLHWFVSSFVCMVPYRHVIAFLSFPTLDHKFPTPSFSLTSHRNRNEIIETNPTPENNFEDDPKYWCIAPTFHFPHPRTLSPSLRHALETNTHPIGERQDSLGQGIFLVRDWRRAWYTYQVPAHLSTSTTNNHTIPSNVEFGLTEYEIDHIEGNVPLDLIGVLYRNGPGKFGVDGERVRHVLDADGLILQVTFPPPSHSKSDTNTNHQKDGRKFIVRSRLVQTEALQKEEQAGEFLYRGTFGTAPRGLQALYGKSPRSGLNQDPSDVPLLSKIAANAFHTNIKNTANTQVISFGGKILALFEAGLPHRIDPISLETLGEDEMGGMLPKGKLAVKFSSDSGIPSTFLPTFVGGAAHTAHPNICPKTGNLVGWHWSQLIDRQALEITFTEWAQQDFKPISSSTFVLPNCELAPHDMAITENCIILMINALKMRHTDFLLGIKGPAEALQMDGRANVHVHVFPRPTAKTKFEPFCVEAPATFSIHFSHAYEDPMTGHLVTMFSGWPPSDSKDFLGAWGGFAPNFEIIPPTFLHKLVMDPKTRKCIDLSIAPGSSNVCAEHPLVHPNFTTRPAKNVYAVGSNLVGDSSAPCGYVRLRVEDGDTTPLPPGTKNTAVDAYWFGSRYFAGEPLIVPKCNSDLEDETAAYLLGMVQDSVGHKSAIAIFDLARELRSGPVCLMWLKQSIPHGLHGCFALGTDGGGPSVFC